MANGTIPGSRLAQPGDLKKLNSERDVQSQFESTDLPILSKGSVLFVDADSRNGQPNSCYNCLMMNKRSHTCTIIGPNIQLDRFVWPPQPKEGELQIEYWPVCGYHMFGHPYGGDPYYAKHLSDPDDAGLIWINAPSVGQKYGGSNCGGINGGDNCDYYKTDGPPEESESGFCRVLQQNVGAGDCCAAWHDDDEVSWQTAQECLNGRDDKKRLVRDIMGKE
jgi:hypothetical protein